MDFILLSGIILSVLLILIAITWAFYRRPTKDFAYVRTGWGGQRVILNNGAFVFPVLHEVMPVNMKTLRVDIEREHKAALITKDPLRVDVLAEFFLRVPEDDEAIKVAARALGRRTLEKEEMKEFVEAQCVAALRHVAASMDLEELHENRKTFEHNVEQVLGKEFKKNGLELVSVSLKRLDQTEKQYFDPTNTFDAQGLIKLDAISEKSRKQRNAIEQDSDVAIQEKNKEAAQFKLKIEQQEVKAQKEQEKHIAELHARTEKEIEQIKIENEIAIENAKREMEVKQAEFEKNTLEAWKITEEFKIEATKVTEQVATTREQAEAERDKLLEVISAKKEAERQTIIATANADVEKLAAAAAKVRYEVEAAGKAALNNASNLLSNDQISMQVKMEIVRQLPQIISESVKPIENIDGIKIMHLDGLANAMGGKAGGGVASASQGNNGSHGGGAVGDNLPDQMVNSLLRYKAQAPLVENLLNEVGLKGTGLNDLTQTLRDELTSTDNSEKPSDAELIAGQDNTPDTEETPPTETKH